MSDALPFEERSFLSATVHLPEPGVEGPPAVLVCWPGGSYQRAYWDMHIPGQHRYSFAEHLTAQGFVVLAVDHLGVGASTKPADGDRVDFETMSAAAASFIAQARAMAADGSPELGGRPLGSLPFIGVGHSLGACLTVVTQARHRCYDAVALLGFTHGEKEAAVSAVGADGRETATEQAKAFFGDAWDDVYALAPRAAHHAWLHDPDVPDDVIAADDALAAPWPRQSYVEALQAGHSVRFAADVECNVFLGFGDHDVPPLPHADVAYYTRSDDVTLHVLRNSAHCHNFASSRTDLWDRIGSWAREQHV